LVFIQYVEDGVMSLTASRYRHYKTPTVRGRHVLKEFCPLIIRDLARHPNVIRIEVGQAKRIYRPKNPADSLIEVEFLNLDSEHGVDEPSLQVLLKAGGSEQLLTVTMKENGAVMADTLKELHRLAVS